MTLNMLGICLAILGTVIIQTLVLLFGFSVGFVTAATAIKDELQKKFQTGEYVLGSNPPETLNLP